MQIYDVTARFSRTIQVREYEPATAEIILKAQLAEGEDATVVVTESLRLAAEQVHQALGLAPTTKLDVKRTASGPRTAAEPADKTGRKSVEKTSQAAGGAADIPGEEEPKKVVAKTTPASDIPGDPAPAKNTPAPAAEVVAATDVLAVSKRIGELVKTGKISGADVKAMYPKFNILQSKDLKPDQIASFLQALDELVARTAAAADL